MERKHNLLPEYVWMIFVGILLAIIIFMHITPGHADESSSPSVTPVPTSALDPTDACLVVGIHESDYLLFTLTGAEISSLSISELYDQAYFVRYGSAGDSTLFLRDVKIALTQLKSQFQGFFVSILDLGASLNAYNAMYSAISEVGVPISLGYLDFSQNRVLQMVNTNFINAPVWVWNSNIPTPSPIPSPDYESVFFKFSYEEGGSFYYRLVEISAEDFGFSVPLDRVNSSFLNFVASNHGVQLDSLSGASFVMRSGSSGYYIATTAKNAFWVYFTAESLNFVKIYSIPDVVSYAKDPLELIDTYTGSDLSQYPNYFCQFSSPTVSNVYGLVFSQAKVSTSSWIASFTLGDVYGFDYVLQSISSTSTFMTDGNFYSNSESSGSTTVIGYDGLFGLLGSLDPEPNPNGPTPTLAPTSTPVPLPTSGESIHVILPSGTPAPTPPFTIQPGGGGGNGSPGSFGGNGLSSGETSGILQAFSMYVSDNPVFAFLGGLFSAFPAELMYPLYILLFILIILGIIRVFIHFTGG